MFSPRLWRKRDKRFENYLGVILIDPIRRWEHRALSADWFWFTTSPASVQSCTVFQTPAESFCIHVPSREAAQPLMIKPLFRSRLLWLNLHRSSVSWHSQRLVRALSPLAPDLASCCNFSPRSYIWWNVDDWAFSCASIEHPALAHELFWQSQFPMTQFWAIKKGCIYARRTIFEWSFVMKEKRLPE